MKSRMAYANKLVIFFSNLRLDLPVFLRNLSEDDYSEQQEKNSREARYLMTHGSSGESVK